MEYDYAKIVKDIPHKQVSKWQKYSKKRQKRALSILMYSVCKYLMASEEGSVSDIAVTTVSTSAPVNAFCISSNCRYKAFTVCTSGYMVSFLPTTQMRL